MKNRDLGVRTLINSLGALLVVFIIYLGLTHTFRLGFALFVALVAAMAVWEYAVLIKKKGLFPAYAISIASVVLYILAVFAQTQLMHLHRFWGNVPQFVLWFSFFSCFAYCACAAKPPITNVSASFLGIVYIAVPLALILKIMYFFDSNAVEGAWWVVYLIVVTKSSDIGGYFLGSYFGKHKLALKLSPNKTLEGAIGGLIISILASMLICYLRVQFGKAFGKFSYVESIWLGLIVGLLGQIGDLAESFLKRDAGAKDSNAIPGVGGVLDMIDSLLFTAPVVYIFLIFNN